MLRAAGADLPDEEVVALARRTEGWAAGLYLAALSRTAARLRRRQPAAGRRGPAGRGLSAVRVALPALRARPVLPDPDRRCSIACRGPLCDAVLEESGSAAVLEHLRQDNLFLVPLDGRGEWYRYHSAVPGPAPGRLERGGRDHARTLLRRAADWCEADGQLETALHYAQDADDVDRVARIAIALAQPMYASGRSATVMGWFDWVDAAGRGRATSGDRRAGGLHLRAHRTTRCRRPLGGSRGTLVRPALGGRRRLRASRCG